MLCSEINVSDILDHDVVLSSFSEYRSRTSTIYFNAIIDRYYDLIGKGYPEIVNSVINEYLAHNPENTKFICHTRKAKKDLFSIIDIKADNNYIIHHVTERLKRKQSFLDSFKLYKMRKELENPKPSKAAFKRKDDSSHKSNGHIGNDNIKLLSILSDRVKRVKCEIDEIDRELDELLMTSAFSTDRNIDKTDIDLEKMKTFPTDGQLEEQRIDELLKVVDVSNERYHSIKSEAAVSNEIEEVEASESNELLIASRFVSTSLVANDLQEMFSHEAVSALPQVQPNPNYMLNLMEYYFHRYFCDNRENLQDGYYFVLSGLVEITDMDILAMDEILKKIGWRQLNSLDPKRNKGRMYAEGISTTRFKKLPRAIQIFCLSVRRLLVRFNQCGSIGDRHVHGPSFIRLVSTVTGSQGWHIDNHVRYRDQLEVEPSYDSEKISVFPFNNCESFRDMGYSIFLGLDDVNSVKVGRVNNDSNRTMIDEGSVSFDRGSVFVITDNKPHEGDCFKGKNREKPSYKLFMSSNEFGSVSGNNTIQRWFRGCALDQYWLRTSVCA